MEPDYKNLFENLPGLYLILDTQLVIVAVSDEYLKATHTIREKILGKGIFEVFPDNPDDSGATGEKNVGASLRSVIKTGLADKMAIQKYDIRKSEEEGGGFEEHYWSPVNLPLLDTNNKVQYIIHSVEDVTELIKIKEKRLADEKQVLTLKEINSKMDLEISARAKEIEQVNINLRETNDQLLAKTKDLQRSNEDLARFAETAAHDIKAPFRAVGGYLAIIKEKIKTKYNTSEFDEYFSRVENGRAKITTLLDDLLNFARVAQSNEPFDDVDTRKVVDEIMKGSELNIKEHDAEFKIKDMLPVIKGEKFQIVQLFQNIIDNAIKFQDKNNPEIIIGASKKDKLIEFSIKDNGIGMNPKHFNKIFEVFERLHSQEEFPGSGLGLAICKRIVERHGGTLWVESEQGKGTTFYFTLQSA